jgi:cytochrome o ubiquinol oxidase subunit 2
MRWNFIWAAVAALIIAGIVAFAWTHGAELSVLNPQGPIGLQERWVIGMTVGLSAIVVIPVFIILFVFAWRYRANNPKARKEHEPNWDHDNWWAEFVWWLVPTAIVICLSVIAWQTTHALDPFKQLQGSEPPITIDVIALDWKWLFIYPAQGIATVNMVEFPTNAPVHFYITSDAPMNSFWIPSLGGQIMTMPGMTTQLNLLASKDGSFDGSSANISGDGFAGMSFTAKSVSEDDFNAWVQSVRQGSNPLNISSYAELAQPSEYNPVTTYSSVTGDLFTTNVMKYMMDTSMMMPATQPTSAPAAAPVIQNTQNLNGTQTMQNMEEMNNMPMPSTPATQAAPAS